MVQHCTCLRGHGTLKDTLPHYHARRRAITLAPVFSTTPSPIENALAGSTDDVIDLTTGGDEAWLPVECSRQFTSRPLGEETISLVLGAGTSEEPLGDSRASLNAVEKVPTSSAAQTSAAQTLRLRPIRPRRLRLRPTRPRPPCGRRRWRAWSKRRGKATAVLGQSWWPGLAA